MQRMGAQAMGNLEKNLRPLFTSGLDHKRAQGKSLWNLHGMKYFHRAGKKCRQVYDSKKDMTVLYNGLERWITTTGSDIKIEDGSKKTNKTVMGTWHVDTLQTLKVGETQDDEETWGLEGEYSSDRGHSTHSLVIIVVSLGKIGRLRVKEKRKKKGKTWMGRMKGVHHCLREQKRGVAKQTAMMC
jgi:hypothetical protein